MFLSGLHFERFNQDFHNANFTKISKSRWLMCGSQKIIFLITRQFSISCFLNYYERFWHRLNFVFKEKISSISLALFFYEQKQWPKSSMCGWQEFPQIVIKWFILLLHGKLRFDFKIYLILVTRTKFGTEWGIFNMIKMISRFGRKSRVSCHFQLFTKWGRSSFRGHWLICGLWMKWIAILCQYFPFTNLVTRLVLFQIIQL